jgi:hypothetical protein
MSDLAARAHWKLWLELGQERSARLDPGRSTTVASATESWYGPVGLVIVCVGLGLALRLETWRKQPVVAFLALAPLGWLFAFALVIGYSPWQGRYLMPGVMLGAAACAPVLYRPVVAWWAVAISATMLVLIWTHSSERPSGVRLLDHEPPPASVWTRDDASALGVTRGTPAAIRFVASRIAPSATLAIYPAPFPDPDTPEPVALHPWPFFGARLNRKVVYALSLRAAGEAVADWALLPAFLTVSCEPGWRRETRRGAAYQAFRHDLSYRCP